MINSGELPNEIGDFTTIQRHSSNKNPLPRPKHFFDVAHIDIAYGDSVALGAIKYILLIVDRKTRYAIERPLQNMTADSIISQLQYVKKTYGRLPQKLYTDFDRKLLSRKVQYFCNQHDCNITACPHNQQNQNGLYEQR